MAMTFNNFLVPEQASGTRKNHVSGKGSRMPVLLVEWSLMNPALHRVQTRLWTKYTPAEAGTTNVCQFSKI